MVDRHVNPSAHHDSNPGADTREMACPRCFMGFMRFMGVVDLMDSMARDSHLTPIRELALP
jgi:hypothetical protein